MNLFKNKTKIPLPLFWNSSLYPILYLLAKLQKFLIRLKNTIYFIKVILSRAFCGKKHIDNRPNAHTAKSK